MNCPDGIPFPTNGTDDPQKILLCGEYIVGQVARGKAG
jgi:hypothetical protein